MVPKIKLILDGVTPAPWYAGKVLSPGDRHLSLYRDGNRWCVFCRDHARFLMFLGYARADSEKPPREIENQLKASEDRKIHLLNGRQVTVAGWGGKVRIEDLHA